MFSSFNYLKRKTPEQGVNRKEFIEHLVEEYYNTTDVGKIYMNKASTFIQLSYF